MDEEKVEEAGVGEEEVEVQVITTPSEVQNHTLHQTPLLPRKFQKYLPRVSSISLPRGSPEHHRDAPKRSDEL